MKNGNPRKSIHKTLALSISMLISNINEIPGRMAEVITFLLPITVEQMIPKINC